MKLNQRSSYQPHPKNFDETFAEVAQRVRPSAYMTPAVAPQAIKQMLQMPLEKITDFWIVDIDNQSVGTIGATVVNENEGYLGFFEVDTHSDKAEEIASALISTATEWLKKKQIKVIFGPINYNTWFPYRLNTTTGPYKTYSWEPINPPEYVEYFKKSGMEVEQRYETTGVKNCEGMAARYKKAHDLVLAQGFTLKSAGEIETPLLLKQLHRLTNIEFAQNFRFEQIPLTIFEAIYGPQVEKMATPYSTVILAPNDDLAGLVIAFEDKGDLVVKTLVVGAAYQGMKLGAALLYHVCQTGVDNQLDLFISALMQGDNKSNSFAAGMKTVFTHEYCLYKRGCAE
ncbi:MAG: hypothetical protein CMP10_08865 [Zetaproteobacteria bacterium]|nr:hypothetical protein [Pseudobdellovibrionaceae bacterium]